LLTVEQQSNPALAIASAVVLNTKKPKPVRHIMKRIILCFLYTFLIIGYIFGQENLDKSIDSLSYNRELKEFYGTIAPTLLNNLSEKPLARYFPIYSMGYGGCLISIDNDSLDKPKLTSHCYSFKTILSKVRSVKIEENSLCISSEFSDKVVKLIEMAIYQINYVEKPSFGLDGITYLFLAKDANGKSMIAETWSPDEGTNLNKIILICNDLAPVAKGNQKYTEKISERIDKLLVELKE